jgi:hypothetical protein
MRTDDLIQILASDLRSPAPRFVPQLLATTIIGGIVSIAGFAWAFGPRDDLLDALMAPAFLAKIAVALILAATVAPVLPAMARPGCAVRFGWAFLAPALLAALIMIDLLAHPAGEWVSRLVGVNAYVCLSAIPLLGLGPLVGLLAGLRSGAPTRPALTGALAGVLAGALAASLYALHCPDDSPLFVAAWYSLAIMIVAGAGAIAGRFVLRW